MNNKQFEEIKYFFSFLDHFIRNTSWLNTSVKNSANQTKNIHKKQRRNLMSFKALIIEKDEQGTSSAVKSIEESNLPEGEVLVKVEYSTVNYKDGLCVGSGGGLVKNYPHVAGIDFAGEVESSTDSRYKPKDKVVLTGWRVGEAWWGGYSQKARVKADWLVPLPEKLSTRNAMAVGTAGFSSMLAILSLESQGLKPSNGPVLVTGAAGGVGSIAVAILANLGYEVAAVTGRPETEEYLKGLGATTIIKREDINEAIKRPLEAETWAGCVDVVGGSMLARVLGQLKYGAAVSAVGLAGGTSLPASVIPFLLRGVKLIGIDSVMKPYEDRVTAWNRIASDLPMEKLESMILEATLEDVPRLGAEILKGGIKGRVVVDLNA